MTNRFSICAIICGVCSFGLNAMQSGSTVFYYNQTLAASCLVTKIKDNLIDLSVVSGISGTCTKKSPKNSVWTYPARCLKGNSFKKVSSAEVFTPEAGFELPKNSPLRHGLRISVTNHAGYRGCIWGFREWENKQEVLVLFGKIGHMARSYGDGDGGCDAYMAWFQYANESSFIEVFAMEDVDQFKVEKPISPSGCDIF